jgi:hypothetical protein
VRIGLEEGDVVRGIEDRWKARVGVVGVVVGRWHVSRRLANGIVMYIGRAFMTLSAHPYVSNASLSPYLPSTSATQSGELGTY